VERVADVPSTSPTPSPAAAPLLKPATGAQGMAVGCPGAKLGVAEGDKVKVSKAPAALR
jgi:hypothetical protein